MAQYFNITGADAAAAILTRELVAPGIGARLAKISLTNIHSSSSCTVDLYISKVGKGKFYIFKNMELPIGVTFSGKIPKFNNETDGYGLYLKLNQSDAEIPSVDVILE